LINAAGALFKTTKVYHTSVWLETFIPFSKLNAIVARGIEVGEMSDVAYRLQQLTV
jgi:hypothetical protein